MEDYNFQDLKNERLMMIVTSTFGNGDPPGNGEVSANILTFNRLNLSNDLADHIMAVIITV